MKLSRGFSSTSVGTEMETLPQREGAMLAARHALHTSDTCTLHLA